MTDRPIKLDEIVDALDSFIDEETYYYSKSSASLFPIDDDAMSIVEDEAEAAEEAEEEEDEYFDEFSECDRESLELARRVFADEDDFIRLPNQFEIHEYSIIQKFCWSRPDEAVSRELSDLIRGSGAFGRFGRAIRRLRIQDDWYKYRNDAFRQISRDWCEENNIPYMEERDEARSTEGDAADARLTEKARLYDLLLQQLAELLAGERDLIANAANMASLLQGSLPDVNWAGFYFHKDGQLILGPFQGKPACSRIAVGKGVCGRPQAAARRSWSKTSVNFPDTSPATKPVDRKS